MIHSRYLASSPIWAQYLKTESVETLALGSSNDLQEDDDQEDEDEEEEAFKRGSGSDVDIKTSTAGGGGGMKMTSFESSLLHSNPLLVKKRIVQALKGAEGQFLRHTAVARTIVSCPSSLFLSSRMIYFQRESSTDKKAITGSHR